MNTSNFIIHTPIRKRINISSSLIASASRMPLDARRETVPVSGAHPDCPDEVHPGELIARYLAQKKIATYFRMLRMMTYPD